VTESGPRRCPVCGRPVSWSGVGRPPTYDRASCRTRAWETRRAGASAVDNEHQAAAAAPSQTAERTASAPSTPAPATARAWAEMLDVLAGELLAGPIGARHWDHRHLYGALLRVLGALDAAHPGGLDALDPASRRRR
jgi:hypothetical protein